MAYCRKCGAEIDEEAVICPKCGVEQRPKNANDDGSILWAIIGFLIPIVGIILFAVWHSERPKSAKMSIIGALVSIGVGILIWVIFVVFAISWGASS
jgi:uncharacterized membrane protein YvbJ